MTCLRPIRHFLAWIVPGQALAALVAALAAPGSPDLAPAILLTLGFLGYAVAVSAAARAPRGKGRRGDAAVIAVLDLRRNRSRYALAFAVLGVLAGAAALYISGLGAAIAAGAGHVALALALGYVSSWLIIGEAACSQVAIRDALLNGRERT